MPATVRGLKARERVKNAIEAFSSMLEPIQSANPVPCDKLAGATQSVPTN
jgi:hypothetical protein